MKNILIITWYLLLANTMFAYDRQDTLRGSNGSGRSWWDVQHYQLDVRFDTANKSISGSNEIAFKVITAPIDSLQLDLQELMFLDKVTMDGQDLPFIKEGNVWWVKFPFHTLTAGTEKTLVATYHGKPHEAVHPPWDGGFIWTKDSTGRPWMAVACQGFGASCWWPCKDYQGDEPDSGMQLSFSVPAGMTVVSNGRAIRTSSLSGYDTKVFEVKNPINSYDATFYIGNYVHWSDTLNGEKGVLDLDFYALSQNEAKARKQFAEAKPMIHCFEYWMGPYPFYEDGYKLVEAPYLGMEHQSAVAYGNLYKMGYLGRDRSGTGVGLLFDFIIIHESSHEWFGNNITAKDITDNWIHEGFTTYTEGLYAECQFGKEKAFQYIRGEWRNITNDRPVLGDHGVNDEGTGDKYDKGSAVVHMIRMMLNDDEKFRQLLRGLNQHFYHQTVTEEAFEQYISQSTGVDFKMLFDQYLRTNLIPELQYYVKKKELYYRFNNIIPGFTLPLRIENKDGIQLSPSSEWQHVRWKSGQPEFSRDFLVRYKEGE
jgi:aminopeptidase N